MANRLYREEAYLEKLELLLRTAKELAACRAQLEALDRRGVPEGSVIFSRPVKRYRRKNGEETVYRYTCEYLYIKGKKYYVSKKHRYPKRPRPGTDENDPENPDNRRLLAGWLELRTEIRRKVRERKKLVTLYCGVLNAMKPPEAGAAGARRRYWRRLGKHTSARRNTQVSARSWTGAAPAGTASRRRGATLTRMRFTEAAESASVQRTS